jgi:hypothetical protein
VATVPVKPPPVGLMLHVNAAVLYPRSADAKALA